MTNDDAQESLVDLETVQAELASILSTMSWTRARLEDVKAELLRWMTDAAESRAPNPDLSHQHDSSEDPVDNAIIAEHERLMEVPD